MSLFDVQKVVVPIDFSDESFAALEAALEIANNQASKVFVVHVLAELSPAEPGVIWGEISNENRARHVEEALEERLSDERYRGINVHVAFGDAGYRIAHFAEAIEADLIVIPSHGRTGLERLLIGSVAQRVIQFSHCPVLVLRSGTVR
jgi:nucleotide-binding universal stress UspA family protein